MKRKQFVKSEDKINLFKRCLDEEIIGKKSFISNDELRDLMKKKYDATIYEQEIAKLGFRDLLEENGITTKLSHKNNKKEIIDKTINYIKENNIEIKTVADIHRFALSFGSISRATLDNYLSHITKSIDIKNLKYRKRAKALEKSDEEIIMEVAKKIIKKMFMLLLRVNLENTRIVIIAQ